MRRQERLQRGYSNLAEIFAAEPYSQKPVHRDPEALTLRSAQDHVDGIGSLDEVEEIYTTAANGQKKRGIVFAAAGIAALGEAYLNNRHGNTGEIVRHALHIAEGVVLVKFAGAFRNAREHKRVVRAAEEVETRLRKQANNYPTEVGLLPDHLLEDEKGS